MKTQEVTFIKYHGAFAHEVGETATLQDADAKRLIDTGYAVAGKKTSVATTPTGAENAMVTPISEKSVNAVAKQRSEAHQAKATTQIIGSLLGPVEVPVAIEENGNRVLVKPEDQALKQADNGPAPEEPVDTAVADSDKK
jgi:ABC-type Na+ efflux pump permease subunit